jgi:hypothetical protein
MFSKLFQSPHKAPTENPGFNGNPAQVQALLGRKPRPGPLYGANTAIGKWGGNYLILLYYSGRTAIQGPRALRAGPPAQLPRTTDFSPAGKWAHVAYTHWQQTSTQWGALGDCAGSLSLLLAAHSRDQAMHGPLALLGPCMQHAARLYCTGGRILPTMPPLPCPHPHLNAWS